MNKPKANHKVTVLVKIPRIMSHKDLMKFLKLDSKKWEIIKIEPGKSEGYRKDRQVEWHVKNGKVVSGHVKDSGKLLIEPLFSIKVTLQPKIEEIETYREIELFKKKAIAYAPRYKKIIYKKPKNGFLYEILMPDLHLGRLTDKDETGVESSPDLFVKKAKQAIDDLLERGSKYPISRILFPVGNDLFNVNNTMNTTANGTPQREDPRWQRTYQLGKMLIIKAIENMSTIAPVDVLLIKGNHDEERLYYFGDMIHSWFHSNPNVKVDHSAIGRKYYSYGNVLLMFAHGYYENIERLGALMPNEQPIAWSKSLYREVHLGDKHHKKDILLKTEDLKTRVTVRLFRSLADPSVWEYNKGFDSIHAAESMLWQKETGLFGQFLSEGKK